ncbi:MAG: glucose-6-phosphate dehydrogenase [Bacteroidales bacterium]|nr:glucose-6-phosphate dehydrogenase [Bacteroidales bacterium]
MTKAENHILVIFGASGDLTMRKLIPAVFELSEQKLLPEKFAVLGVGRTALSDNSFRAKMKESVTAFSSHAKENKANLDNFIGKLHYTGINTSDIADYKLLKDKIEELAISLNIPCNIIYYLATPPSLYEIIPHHLYESGLNMPGCEKGWKRLIIEKPFGTDLETAKTLNRNLLKYFDESQIYRIDHYLGKETVQNVLVTRFSNGIFEPLWNRNYIHRVEITSAENIGVENRGGYYDHSGALRDMLQNHLLQLTALIAMEPPTVVSSTAIRNETMKVFQAFKPLSPDDVINNVIRGQYIASVIRGENVNGYREEKGVDPDSRTETFVAMKFFIDNWRWGGVPFYIRTGKRLPTRVTEVVIHFRQTPHHLFQSMKFLSSTQNQLVIRIQPDEGILLKFGMKVPGAGFEVQNVNMDFHYDSLKDIHLPSAYERLLLDCMQGDQTLYSRGDAVEAAWEFVQPVLDTWKNNPKAPLYGYPAGTWGPDKVVDALLGEAGILWRYPCKNLSNDGEFCEL